MFCRKWTLFFVLTVFLPFQNPWIGECIERGQRVTTEMEVFFKLCPSKIIAVTGSNGKTTTTTLISKFLEAQAKKVYLGGNIGKALMPELETITENDIAVVELSSFQLLTMGNMKNTPDVAVVTNIECTHQDHHVNLDEYVDAKRNIFNLSKQQLPYSFKMLIAIIQSATGFTTI